MYPTKINYLFLTNLQQLGVALVMMMMLLLLLLVLLLMLLMLLSLLSCSLRRHLPRVLPCLRFLLAASFLLVNSVTKS